MTLEILPASKIFLDLKAVAPRQVSDLYQAEREFKQILMRQLKPQGRARGRW